MLGGQAAGEARTRRQIIIDFLACLLGREVASRRQQRSLCAWKVCELEAIDCVRKANKVKHFHENTYDLYLCTLLHEKEQRFNTLISTYV